MRYTVIEAIHQAFLDRWLERYKTVVANGFRDDTWKWMVAGNGLERVDKDLLYRALLLVTDNC